METISIWAIARQKSCLQLYVCLDLKYKVSLSLDRGKSGYEIRRVLRRKPKAKVAMLRLFREEHKYSLAFETSFRLHCRESPIEAYLKERRRRTRRPWKIRFRSFFRNLFDSPRRRHLELPKRCWLKTYVRFLISLNKSIELNKIHHYFTCTSFACRMNY